MPFNAYIPIESEAARIATLPYDVMNRKEAAAMAAGNPISFLHVTRSEIDLDIEDAYSPQVYEKAKENWMRLASKHLKKDAEPHFYVYSLVMNGRRQTGIVATPRVVDYNENRILKHEKTRKEKEDDRTRHISTLRAQTGPVFLTYKDDAAIDRIVAETMKQKPLFDFVAEDGISHAGWRVQDTAALQKAFENVDRLYIADGHHRAASAARTFAADNSGEADRFLAVIFPASQLRILAYNRVLFTLNGRDEAAFLTELGRIAPLRQVANPVPSRTGDVCVYCAGKWYGLTLPEVEGDAISKLDVSRLQSLILQPLLGIEDPRTSRQIDFVGGIRGTAELERRVDSGEAKVAFSMYPTTLEQLMAIADEGGIMPPKSTWFEPKLRDGLFVHEI